MSKVNDYLDNLSNKQLLKEDTDEARSMATTFNSRLSAIGGNTVNFLNYDTIKKLFSENPKLLNDDKIIEIANKIEETYDEWNKLSKEWQAKGRKLREEAQHILNGKSGYKIY